METHKRLEFKTIVVATDFTGTASSALRYAKAIALRHKSVLVVVHVIDPVGYAFPEGIPNSAAADQTAREELRKIEEETQQHGIPIHSVVETGIVFERILQAVEDHHGDLLVLGTRAKTGIGRAALGAVARRLLAKAECPVLTVPPDSQARLPWAGHGVVYWSQRISPRLLCRPSRTRSESPMSNSWFFTQRISRLPTTSSAISSSCGSWLP